MKKFMSVLLVISLLISIVPTMAFANEQIAITSPVSTAPYVEGDVVTITVNAPSDTKLVTYFANNEKIGESAIAPFTFNWINVKQGDYSLTAVSTSVTNANQTSAAVSIIVSATMIQTSPIYSMNFDDYTAETDNAMPTFPLATTLTKKDPATVCAFTSTQAPEKAPGDRCIVFKTKATANGETAICTIDPGQTKNLLQIQFDWYVEGKTESRDFAIRYNGTTYSSVFTLNTSGQITTSLGGSSKLLQNYSDKTWYHMNAVINTLNQTYQLSVNDTNYEQLKMPSSISYIDKYRYRQTADKNTASNTYLNNLFLSNITSGGVAASITAPVAGSKYLSNENITLTATAVTPAGTISKVQYYTDGVLLGESATSPYSVSCKIPYAGIKSIYARAINSGGDSGYSTPIDVMYAPIKLPTIFANDMVLQRGKKINIYGWGIDGETVQVAFNGQTRQTTVVGGKWMATLDPMTAGGPYDLIISVPDFQSGFTWTLSNIMVGEVWLCSGQSNMDFDIQIADNYATEINNANYPNIRLFKQSKLNPTAPATDNDGGKWQVCNPTNIIGFSVTGYFFGRQYYLDHNVPVGLIHAALGGTNILSWYEKMYAQYDPDTKAAHNVNNLNFYGQVAPLKDFSVGGVLWYQGEANATESFSYEKHLSNLIENWRATFNDPNLFFVVTQLPNYNYPVMNGAGSTGVYVREAQLNAMRKIPNVATAFIIDIGNDTNIHPSNKKDVGYRMAKCAEYLQTKDSTMTYTGPVYDKFEFSNGKARVSFRQVGTGLSTKDGLAPKTFELCGADKVFYPANATIVNANTIEVTSVDVPNPIQVRYAWNDIPRVNLVNSLGFPASPFRSDNYHANTTLNFAPSVKITSTFSDTNVQPNQTVTLKAAAEDLDGTVAKVEFYDGSTLIGSDTTSPFEIDWAISKGTHSIKAVATDDKGRTSIESSATARVVAISTSDAPKITLLPFTNANQQEITSLAGNTIINANLTIESTINNSVNPMIAIAIYQGNKLIHVEILYNNDTFVAAGAQAKEISYPIDLSKFTGATNIKVIPMDGATYLQPLTTPCGTLE